MGGREERRWRGLRADIRAVEAVGCGGAWRPAEDMALTLQAQGGSGARVHSAHPAGPFSLWGLVVTAPLPTPASGTQSWLVAERTAAELGPARRDHQTC